MPTTAPVRVGLLGCGYQGQWIAEAIARIAGLSLGACFDPDAEAVAAVRTKVGNDGHSPRLMPSAEALIANEAIDAVIIATPHHLLQPLALQAIAAGKHVLAEKPVALDANQARDLESAAAHGDLVFMSGYSFRYFPLVAKAKQLITDGRIGKIRTLNATMTVPRLRPGWPSDRASGGGMLGFFGCHIIDRVLWYLGKAPSEVFGCIRRGETGVDVTAVFQLAFADGPLASFNVCGAAKGPFDSLQIFGTDGHLSLIAQAFTGFELYMSNDSGDQVCEAPKVERSAAILDKMIAELLEFAEAIRWNRSPAITASDGRRVLDVVDAVLLSGETGRPVSLSDEG